MLIIPCDALSSDSPKIEGIEGNPPLWVREIRRNLARITLAKFFAYDIAGSIGFVRKAAVDSRRLRIFGYFFQIFIPHGADFPFQTYQTQKHAQKSELIFR